MAYNPVCTQVIHRYIPAASLFSGSQSPVFNISHGTHFKEKLWTMAPNPASPLIFLSLLSQKLSKFPRHPLSPTPLPSKFPLSCTFKMHPPYGHSYHCHCYHHHPGPHHPLSIPITGIPALTTVNSQRVLFKNVNHYLSSNWKHPATLTALQINLKSPSLIIYMNLSLISQWVQSLPLSLLYSLLWSHWSLVFTHIKHIPFFVFVFIFVFVLVFFIIFFFLLVLPSPPPPFCPSPPLFSPPPPPQITAWLMPSHHVSLCSDVTISEELIVINFSRIGTVSVRYCCVTNNRKLSVTNSTVHLQVNWELDNLGSIWVLTFFQALDL